METATLKSFATWARKALINEVAGRVTAVLAPSSPERIEQPRSVAALEAAVKEAGGGETGRAAVADRVAYTWFNRIIALRFMDANGYNGIGVVSPQHGVEVGQPEILAEAKRGSFDDAVSSSAAVSALLDGTRPSNDPQGEAYALLLTDYCRHWHRAMPFMFERSGDFTELLMPGNLLADDSVLNRAVTVMTKDVCKDVEVIGWLYQFYISERKDEVFAGFKKGKKAGAAEIPAATQLFTPHWIVRYLVENSVGRLWMLNHPESRLVDQMEYYIAPVDEETDFLKLSGPEELTVMDPACGSGHMLTYAFDLLYAIYQEEGYPPSDIPGLILKHNLFGTEIDPRAGALAAFALTMKARAKQRTFFNKKIEPNICVLEPIRFTSAELEFLLTPDGDRDDEIAFWNQFEHADKIGSLAGCVPAISARLRSHLDSLRTTALDLIAEKTLERAEELANNARLLSSSYHTVIANPPYMGSANMDSALSEFTKLRYPEGKNDLFGCFIERCSELAMTGGWIAMITMQSWMFLGGFERLRRTLLSRDSITAMAHLGTGAFDSLAGEVVSTTAFVINKKLSGRTGKYIRLTGLSTSEDKRHRLQECAKSNIGFFAGDKSLFERIPEAPLAYWITEDEVRLFDVGRLLGTMGHARKGIDTGENSKFVRFWHEVSLATVRIDPANKRARWVPYNKGGPNLRWYGNRYWVVDWLDDGREIKARRSLTSKKSTIRNPDYFYRAGFTYTTVSTGRFAARYTPPNAIFDSGGGTYFSDADLYAYGALLNSRVADRYFEFLAPTLNYQPGDVDRIPVAEGLETLDFETNRAVELAKEIWDSQEHSWDYRGLATSRGDASRVSKWFSTARNLNAQIMEDLTLIESKHDHLIAALYGVELEDPLENEHLPEPLAAAASSLLSYAVGCMFGRYSLDEPGLILADQGATLQDYLTKVPSPTFMPDADNVIPIVDGDWFEDDIVARFRKFLRVSFGEEHFEENLRFVTESLGVKDVREYFVKSFYKDHVQRYKKRPIYWLFSSPKGSFNALIYMHRYTPSTVSTVLNEYLREYKAKLKASQEHQEILAASAGTARDKAKAQKEVDRLRKVLLELDEYEHDVLYPLATQQIAIDLDDGVKANYPKFGAALKKIPGLEAAE